MKKIILYGFLAALFFSSTFAINRWLNVERGGHWFWTASLRYGYVLILLTGFIAARYGLKTLRSAMRCYASAWYFWLMAGGIGFGLFYLSLCFAASFSPGWVLATTWQSTILATPLVIKLLGEKIELKGIVFLGIMFTGIVLVNSYAFTGLPAHALLSVPPILFAAFCYPIGNTLCKYACEGKYPKTKIQEHQASSNVFCQVLMMTLGAMPVLVIAGALLSPPPPSNSQLIYTLIVAISTGVIATSFLYRARQLAENNTLALAAADGTQAIEAPLALFWEWLFFNGVLPNYRGICGLVLLTLGLLLFYYSNRSLGAKFEISYSKGHKNAG